VVDLARLLVSSGDADCVDRMRIARVFGRLSTLAAAREHQVRRAIEAAADPCSVGIARQVHEAGHSLMLCYMGCET
jgi:hypothetical protein